VIDARSSERGDTLSDTHKLARLAGLLYVLSLPTTGFWYGFGSSLAVGDAAAVLANVQMHRETLELALISGALGAVNHLVLAVLLYRLFRQTGQTAAALVLVFTAVSAPLSLAAIARQMDVLALLDAASAIGSEQLRFHVMLAMRGYTNLFLTSAIFWGVWLAPLGWLVWRCGFVPRVLGLLILLGAPFYVLAFAGSIFDPGYQTSLLGRVVGVASGIPDLIGEGGLALWLLIVGTRRPSSPSPKQRERQPLPEAAMSR
jgi:hypothetical protein